MGYGGELLYTAAMARLAQQSGCKVYPARKPLLSDLLAGRLYDCSHDANGSAILRGNPDLGFTRARAKTSLQQKIDDIFAQVANHRNLKRSYEAGVAWATALASRWSKRYYFHIDMERLSYAHRTTPAGIIWKSEPHAVDAILTGVPSVRRPKGAVIDPSGRIFLSPEEISRTQALLRQCNLAEDKFIAIEPHSNPDFFGTQREWPFERWQALVGRLSDAFRDLPIVQIGVGGKLLEGVVDLRGKTSFREAGEVLRACKLFLGTDGGPMHLSRSVGGRAAIVWGCASRPEFVAYPGHHAILAFKREFIPCLSHERCPGSQKCINGIDIDAMFAMVSMSISNGSTGVFTPGDLQGVDG